MRDVYIQHLSLLRDPNTRHWEEKQEIKAHRGEHQRYWDKQPQSPSPCLILGKTALFLGTSPALGRKFRLNTQIPIPETLPNY